MVVGFAERQNAISAESKLLYEMHGFDSFEYT